MCGKGAQKLRGHAALAEDQGSGLSTRVEAHNHLKFLITQSHMHIHKKLIK